MAAPTDEMMTDTADRADAPQDVWGELKGRMAYVVEFEEGGRYAGYSSSEQEFLDSVEFILSN